MTDAALERSLRLAGSVEPNGPGRYRADLSPIYTVMGHPNGGYLQCVMGSAAIAAASDEGASHLHVTAMSSNYSAAPMPGPAEVHTDVRRVGRGASFVHATLIQNDVITVESLVTLGTLQDDATLRYQDATPPNVPPKEECIRSDPSTGITMLQALDQRLDPASASWWAGEVSDVAEIKGWLRLDDGEGQWDPWSLLFAADALPPATFPLGSTGWVPTLQLTTYVRQIPTSEWLRTRQWAIVVAEGLVDERLELFDDAGMLVASSSQLAMVRFPEGR